MSEYPEDPVTECTVYHLPTRSPVSMATKITAYALRHKCRTKFNLGRPRPRYLFDYTPRRIPLSPQGTRISGEKVESQKNDITITNSND